MGLSSGHDGYSRTTISTEDHLTSLRGKNINDFFTGKTNYILPKLPLNLRELTKVPETIFAGSEKGRYVDVPTPHGSITLDLNHVFSTYKAAEKLKHIPRGGELLGALVEEAQIFQGAPSGGQKEDYRSNYVGQLLANSYLKDGKSLHDAFRDLYRDIASGKIRLAGLNAKDNYVASSEDDLATIVRYVLDNGVPTYEGLTAKLPGSDEASLIFMEDSGEFMIVTEGESLSLSQSPELVGELAEILGGSVISPQLSRASFPLEV